MALSTMAPIFLGTLAFLIGISLHVFPLINAAASERWGLRQAGTSLGWINTVGQIAGALSLTFSGYLGSALAAPSGPPASEYFGIWVVGAGGCAVGAVAAWVAGPIAARHGTPRR